MFCNRFIIPNEEWSKYIHKEEIINEIVKVTNIIDYVSSIDRNGIHMENDNVNTFIVCKHSLLKLSNLEKDIEFVDKLLLNVFLLTDNQELIDLGNEECNICIYPRLSDGCSTLFNVYIMDNKYIDYMSYCYFDIINNTMYKYGVEVNKDTIMIGMGSDDPIGCISMISMEDSNNEDYKGCILNKNFITAIKLLGAISLDKDIELVLNDKDLIVNTLNNKKYKFNNRIIHKDKYVIGKVFSNRLLLNEIKPRRMNFSPVLIFD